VSAGKRIDFKWSLDVSASEIVMVFPMSLKSMPGTIIAVYAHSNEVEGSTFTSYGSDRLCSR
jgi:hypothetical protein